MKKLLLTLGFCSLLGMLTACKNDPYPIIELDSSIFQATKDGNVEIKGKLIPTDGGFLNSNINRENKKLLVNKKNGEFSFIYHMNEVNDDKVYLGIENNDSRIAVSTAQIDTAILQEEIEKFETITSDDIVRSFDNSNIPYESVEAIKKGSLEGLKEGIVFDFDKRIDGSSIKAGFLIFDEEKYKDNGIQFPLNVWWKDNVVQSNYKNPLVNESYNVFAEPTVYELIDKMLFKQSDFKNPNDFVWVLKPKKLNVVLVLDSDM
ncbi:hypothetical protein KVJ53_002677, partial [Enterococcus faecalis]|nr:hypothetical protein [Enterococcus faecalis]